MRVLSKISKERGELSADLSSGKPEIRNLSPVESVSSYIQDLRYLRLRNLLISGQASFGTDNFDIPSGIWVGIIEAIHPAVGVFATSYDLLLDPSYFIDREFLVDPKTFLEVQHVLIGKSGDDRQKGVSFGFISRQNQGEGPLTSEEAGRTMEFLEQMGKNEHCMISLEWRTREKWQYADELGVSLEKGNRKFRLEFEDLSRSDSGFRYKIYLRGSMASDVVEEKKRCLEDFYNALVSSSTSGVRIRLLPNSR